MDTLVFIHGNLARTTILFVLGLGVWAGWNYFRKQDLSPNYWGALIIGEILVLGQGMLGVAMAVTGRTPADLIHFLYGVLVALGWPSVYIYTNARATRTEAGFYALMSLFIVGLAIRAMMTGG